MDWLQTALAGFLDKFKTKNPKQYALVAFIIVSLNMIIINAGEFQILPEALPQAVDYAIQIIGQLAAIFLGSRTVKYMDRPAQIKIKEEMDLYD